MKKYTFLSTILLTSALVASEQPSLDQLSIKYGTDKGSSWHNYTPIYERYFQGLKNTPIKFLEIGFLVGSSARMWDQYFSHLESKLHFIDIDQACYKHMKGLSSRCSLHMVSQSNKAQLEDYVDLVGNDFDIIVDDGGHTMVQQITSFQTLFPYLKKGGIYIIEDLHTSYWAQWGSAGSTQNPQASANSAIRFFQTLIDELNYCGARTSCADKSKCPSELQQALNLYQKNIASMHFYSSLCVIIKS